MWARLANKKEWYDYQVASRPPWNINSEGEPAEYPCLVSTEMPSPDIYRHIFIYENDLKEIASLMQGKDPVNLQVIVAPSLTTEGADNSDLDLLVDNREKCFMHTLRQIVDQEDDKHPNALEVSERIGIPLEEGLEVMMRLLKRGFINMSTSPMFISPAEQQMFSMLLRESIKEKKATYSIGTLSNRVEGSREFLAALLISMHEKGMLICKNNRMI